MCVYVHAWWWWGGGGEEGEWGGNISVDSNTFYNKAEIADSDSDNSLHIQAWNFKSAIQHETS